jgi:CDGSH-type Zn-finger protein
MTLPHWLKFEGFNFDHQLKFGNCQILESQMESEKDYSRAKYARKVDRKKVVVTKLTKARNQAYRRVVELRSLHAKNKVSDYLLLEAEENFKEKYGPLESHSFAGDATLAALKELVRGHISSTHTQYLTSLFYCFCACYYAQSMTSIAFSLMQFIDKHYVSEDGLTTDVWNFLMSLNETPTVAEGDYDSLELESHSDGPSWLERIQKYKNNWSVLRSSSLFPKVTKCMCALVSLGLLDQRYCKWSIAGVEVFTKEMTDKAMTAPDCLDAVMQMVTHLADSGCYAFATGKLQAVLYDDPQIMEAEDEYMKCKVLSDHIEPGTLEKMGVDTTEFHGRLDSLIMSLEAITVRTSGVTHTIMLNKKENVLCWMDKLIRWRNANGVRTAPYVMVILGDSSIGKTSHSQITSRSVAVQNGFASTDRHQAVIQGNDKYWTSYKGFTTIVILDDIYNTKMEHAQEDEGMKLIMLKNNQPCYAPKADVAEKGRVPVEPKIVVCTTNDETMQSAMSVNPYSRLRRGDVYIRPTVRDQFRREVNGKLLNEIDEDKVRMYYAERDEDGNPIYVDGVVQSKIVMVPDLWNISLSRPYMEDVAAKKSKIALNRQGTVKKKLCWEIMTIDGVYCENLNIVQCCDLVGMKAKSFFQAQEAVVANINAMNENFVLCECGCKRAKPICDAAKEMLPPPAKIEESESESDSETVEEENYVENEFYDEEFAAQRARMAAADQIEFDRLAKEVKMEDEAALDSHSGVMGFVANTAMSVLRTRFRKLNPWRVNEYVDSNLLEVYRNLECPKWVNLFMWMPDSVFDHRYCQDFLQRIYKEDIRHASYWSLAKKTLVPGAFFGMLGHTLSWCLPKSLFIPANLLLGAIIANGVSYSSAVYAQEGREMIIEKLMKERAAMPLIIKDNRNRFGKLVVGSATVLASALIAVKIYKAFRVLNPIESDSLLHPEDAKDIENRKRLPNDWVDTHVKNPDAEDPGTATLEQLTEIAAANSYTVEYVGETTSRTFGVVMHNGALLVPRHALVETGATEIRMIRKAKVPWSVTIGLDKVNVKMITGKDFAVIYSAKIQGRNLLKHLRDKESDTSYFFSMSTMGRYVYRDGERTHIDETRMSYSPRIHTTRGGTFPGWQYRLREPSFQGACGAALLVMSGRRAVFGGIHLGGRGNTGGGGSFTAEDFDEARKHFEHLPDLADAGKYQEVIEGEKHADLGAEIPKTHPINFVAIDGPVEVLGTATGECTAYSSVKPTMISHSVTRVTGIPNEWGAPKLNPWYNAYHLDLTKRGSQPKGFKVSELQAAVLDFTTTFVYEFNKASPSVKESLIRVPLNRYETLFGVDGVSFIDRMKFITAIGWPFKGPKSKFCILDENGEIIDFQPWVWEAVFKAKEALLAGFRINATYKAQIKDEITKLYKDDGSENDKVRIFTCAPIVLQILLRMYFLPVAALLSTFPLVSECAVGINASGPDFDELIRHLAPSKDTKLIAGDFSKFDIGISADAMGAAFQVMANLAERCLDYSKEDLRMMSMLANEVMNPVVAYHGALLQLSGSNPSGQNMTVYVNSLVNSLYHRCVYRRICGASNQRFSDVYRLTTYGDDSLGAPMPEIQDKMTFNTIKAAFEEVDIKYTPADKSENAPDFVSLEEVDFLKRKPVFNKELEMWMGALDIKSIVKSLHCSASSTLPPDAAAIVNLDNSIREMFNHGRESYEDWRKKVGLIADDHNLRYDLSLLGYDFDAYLERYKARYLRDQL